MREELEGEARRRGAIQEPSPPRIKGGQFTDSPSGIPDSSGSSGGRCLRMATAQGPSWGVARLLGSGHGERRLPVMVSRGGGTLNGISW